MSDDLCNRTATQLAELLSTKQTSAVEVMRAHLEQIDRFNPQVNAIISMVPDQALDAAKAADQLLASGAEVGPLFGLPIAHKDLTPTKGVRTTFGSPVFEHNIPDEDSLLVERLRGAGAIMLGKTNVPEFGTGSQTFNPIFGSTKNPYDLTKTAGGSSGGAAAALAARLLPIADGSDLGGSLRNPASFCNVVGFRPSGHRVPSWPNPHPWITLPVEGPMGRTVQDTALLLSAMAGPDPRSPVVLHDDPTQFLAPLASDVKGKRVAWASDFGGLIPIDQTVVQQLDQHRATFEALGTTTTVAMPDLSGADEVFRTLRALIYAIKCGPLLAEHRHQIKDTAVTNTEIGLNASGADIARAETLHSELFHRTRLFFEQYDYVVLPTVQVPPFDVSQEWVSTINEIDQPDYLGWMASCYLITSTGHPAISVPCGFTEEGLPVGLQLVGRHPDDLGLLRMAYAFEQATEYWKQAPPLLSA